MSVATTTRGRPPAADAGRDEVASRAVALELASSLTLAVYSLIVASSLVRVYGDWSFLGEAVALIVIGHGLPFVLRRLRVPGLVATTMSFVVLAVVAVRFVHPDTFRAVIPTGSTIDAVRLDIEFIGQEFAGAVAPVPFAGGWALLGLLGLAAVVWLADAFAFAAHGRGEALVPGAVLFVFVAALGTDRLALRLTLLLVAAGVVAVATLRANFANPPRTTLGPRRHPLVALLPTAAVASAVVVASAWAVGPRLPGANDEPWVDTHGRGGGGVTEVVSPLVDIRARLVQQADTEMLVVAATAAANWRVSTLAQFDGTTWGLPQRPLQGAGGDLNDPRPGSLPNAQQITIGALGGRLVPAAADPVAVDGEGLRFNADSSTLVRTDRALQPGDAYAVESAMPVFEVEALRAATVDDPPDPIYLELPDDLPDVARQLAVAQTAGATTPYDQARMLQDWFRSAFQYSLDVPAGHSSSAIESFLERRTGYCEQFAGTMAAMARSLGLPARVAVGFTTGVPGADGAYRVTGRQAHAWPEIWFDGYGWVPFEPTPGRGAPGLENVTGVPPEQDAATPPPDGAQDAPPPTVTPTTARPNLPDDPDAAGAGTPDVVTPVDEAGGDGGGLPWRWLLVVAVIAGLAAATPALARRLRRRTASTDPAQHVADLWARARRAVEASTGERLDPTRTPLEQARDVAPRLEPAAQPMRALAEVATAARFGPPGVLDDGGLEAFGAVDGPDRWCHEIETVAADAMPPVTRVKRYFTNWN